MTRRSARGQNLPEYEAEILRNLDGNELFQRARMLYQSGWTLRSIGEAFEPPRARSTIRYWINSPTPIASVYTDLPTTPIPTLQTAATRPKKPRRPLTAPEANRIATLAPSARKYRATMKPGHASAKANREMTELCARLHHIERVTIGDLADAANVSYRAMARRVS
ncbi:DNA binding protein [Microbacterium phage Zooman]|nr:DNA binding protein [Microbacterium phage Zooman]